MTDSAVSNSTPLLDHLPYATAEELPRAVVAYAVAAWLASAVTVATIIAGVLPPTTVYSVMAGLWAGGAVVARAEWRRITIVDTEVTPSRNSASGSWPS